MPNVSIDYYLVDKKFNLSTESDLMDWFFQKINPFFINFPFKYFSIFGNDLCFRILLSADGISNTDHLKDLDNFKKSKVLMLEVKKDKFVIIIDKTFLDSIDDITFLYNKIAKVFARMIFEKILDFCSIKGINNDNRVDLFVDFFASTYFPSKIVPQKHPDYYPLMSDIEIELFGPPDISNIQFCNYA